MGWFDNLWSGIKNTVSDVWSGIKNVAGSVYDTVRKPVDWISDVGGKLGNIPIVGSFIKPVLGVVNEAKGALDQAKAIGEAVKSAGLQNGGIVRDRMYEAKKKFYQSG